MVTLLTTIGVAGCSGNGAMTVTTTATATGSPSEDSGDAPSVAPQPRMASECDPNYAGGCVPVLSYDLDCPDIGIDVEVIGVDVHEFDRDLDGYGCETYG